MAEGMGENRSNVRYVGAMQGGFTAIGLSTRIPYYVDGRGATLTVDSADAPGFLSRYTNGRADFELVVAPPDAKDAPFAPVSAKASLGNVPGNLASMNSLSAKDAVSLIETTEDLPDLMVWRAEEQARDQPRKTVLAAIEAQINSVAAGIGQDG